ncbi:unnamed protein product [Pleuronectes platessa]|uniref:Uncharacterized protein n=1 Tax=Pleuronectes platessa TaxID=8262 RepID=A0A9N7V3H0_PLEPL|nr:unnamed protein product [Pleuronectes platessa]
MDHQYHIFPSSFVKHRQALNSRHSPEGAVCENTNAKGESLLTFSGVFSGKPSGKKSAELPECPNVRTQQEIHLWVHRKRVGIESPDGSGLSLQFPPAPLSQAVWHKKPPGPVDTGIKRHNEETDWEATSLERNTSCHLMDIVTFLCAFNFQPLRAQDPACCNHAAEFSSCKEACDQLATIKSESRLKHLLQRLPSYCPESMFLEVLPHNPTTLAGQRMKNGKVPPQSKMLTRVARHPPRQGENHSKSTVQDLRVSKKPSLYNITD